MKNEGGTQMENQRIFLDGGPGGGGSNNNKKIN